MAKRLNYQKASREAQYARHGDQLTQFEKEAKSGRPMTLAQRRYLNDLCDQHKEERITRRLTVFEASEEISRLKHAPAPTE